MITYWVEGGLLGVLLQKRRKIDKKPAGTSLVALNAGSQSLSKSKARWQVATLLTGPFAAIGRAAIAWTGNLGASTIFLLLASLKIFGTKQVSKIVQQVYYLGARSTMIIMLVGLFTGMVVGLQSYHALVKFGAEGALGALVALSLVSFLKSINPFSISVWMSCTLSRLPTSTPSYP